MRPLISARELMDRLDDPAVRIVDVRFDLADPAAGRMRFRDGHLPGAVYLHIDEDLSGPLREDGIGGRHPLPDPERLAATLGRLGIGDDHLVVAYDDAGGAFAGRLWWLLHWIGRPAVRVLDGGVAGWIAAGGALASTPVASTPGEAPRSAASTASVDGAMVVTADEVRTLAARPDAVVIDARAAERYRGDTEPLDPKAGHVPGAVNRPYAGNLRPDGTFLAPDRLRERFALREGVENVVVYCGSGVTAVHDALAMVVAGLPMPRLYAGSWSDWSNREGFPVATGEAEAHPPHDGRR